MSTNVLMPQMGESIVEGTIVRWIKAVGDVVERDEPLFEISTDKVDAEIPSPAAGVVAEIRAKEGETVPVSSVVAVIAPAGTKIESKPGESGRGDSSRTESAPGDTGRGAPNRRDSQRGEVGRADSPRVRPAAPESQQPSKAGPIQGGHQRSSPLVRRIASEHGVDLAEVQGTGEGGRVTRDDILAFISRSSQPTARATTPAVGARPSGLLSPSAIGAGLAGEVVSMSVMRRKIAEHMTASQRTSVHVHSVFEVNFDRIEFIRTARQVEYERAGTKLTYLSFIVSAAAKALRAVPVLNASVLDDKIVYHQAVNIGVAVALDWGLIVPVVRNVDEKPLLDISRAIGDLAARARAKQLKPQEVAEGTFTVTNPGAFGALFGMPIINQPQVAILGVGAVEKRPIVINDAIAIRPTAHLTLGFDHRIIDGAVADTFMSHIKRTLENWDPARP